MKQNATANNLMMKWASRRWIGVLVLAGIAILLSLFSPQFLTFGNLINVLRQVSVNALIALGMTVVIVSGGIDLSVGSILALSSCAGLMVMDRWGDGAGIALTLMLGTFCGLLNGTLVTRFKLQPFIVTLASMTAFRGLALSLTSSEPILRIDGWYRILGTGHWLSIPAPVLLMAGVFLVLLLVFKRQALGVLWIAVGANEEASRLNGVSVARVRTLAYGLSGLLAATAGLVLSARLGSAQPSAGEAFELDAIAAYVLGGNRLSGGRASLMGTLLGAVMIGVLNNGFNLLAIDNHIQMIFKGSMIVIAVIADQAITKTNWRKTWGGPTKLQGARAP